MKQVPTVIKSSIWSILSFTRVIFSCILHLSSVITDKVRKNTDTNSISAEIIFQPFPCLAGMLPVQPPFLRFHGLRPTLSYQL